MTPEIETHHAHHHTGHRWVDYSVAACALIVSFCSLGIAIHHGHTMEKLVQANSLPFLQFMDSNGETRPDGSLAMVLSYQVRNAGPGPARIEWFKQYLDDNPIADWNAVLTAGLQELKKASPDTTNTVAIGTLTTADVAPYFMKGGDSVTAARWERTQENASLWQVIDKARLSQRVRLQACYCSIFDECWIADSKVFKPKLVEKC
jgi:hypothetical protein